MEAWGHLRIKKKVVRANENAEKPSETLDNSFYLRLLPKRKSNIWFYK